MDLVELLASLPEKKLRGLEMYRNGYKQYTVQEFSLAAEEMKKYRESVVHMTELVKTLQPKALSEAIEDFLL